VEQIEKNKNAQLSREIELALPVELSAGRNISLVREYVNRHFVSAGMCADICIHDKNDGNPHAHIMLIMRPMEQDGSWAAKSKKEYILDSNGQRILLKSGALKTHKVDMVDWNDQTKAEEWRQGWAEAVNRFLEQNNHAERIDHRSYERQGVEQIPAVHLGVAAFQMERRGITTERGNMNRQIQVTNKELRQLRARINHLKSWLAGAETAEPSLQDVFSEILGGSGNKTRWQKTADLKTAAKVLAFLQANGITTMPELRQKVMDMHGQRSAISDKISKIERRLKTLDEHIRQSETYLKHKALYKQYQQLKPNKREAFDNIHSSEIILYEAAEKYLKAHMNGKTTLPIKAWKDEASKLTAEKNVLYKDFYKLRDEVHDVEIIRYNAERVMQADRPDTEIKRTHKMEL